MTEAVRRAQALWALQYDRKPDDLPLLRLLAAQEARSPRELTDVLALAGFLLAEHRSVEDVWLHHEIKATDFDTWCGYDVEHLFAAGVAETVAFVRASEHPDRDEVLELLLDADGEPRLTDEDLAEWRGYKREHFPLDPADEHPLTLVERAHATGDLARARELLDRWAADCPRDLGTLSRLRHELSGLGAFAEAAVVQRESLALVSGAWDTASALWTLAGLQRRAGALQQAWEALQACRSALDDVSEWQEAGLGRMYVEELFLVAGAASGELAAEVFAEADRQAAEVPRLPPVVFEAAAHAASRVDQSKVEHYERLRDATTTETAPGT